jgi:hypothetical protein
MKDLVHGGDAMSTKAEDFRYWAERSGPKKPRQPARPKRNVPVDTSKPGVSATDRKGRAPRNESSRAGKKAVYTLEETKGRPSRKSTRKSANRQKTDTAMRAKIRTAEVRADSRFARHGP